MSRLANAFERENEAAVMVTAGSTGKLYAQIQNGAPFEVFLAADTRRPTLLETNGTAVAGSRFTYAIGRLALCGAAVAHPRDGRLDLRAGSFRHLAIANPETAPYGVAAEQVLRGLGLWESLAPRLIVGENIAQAYQFVRSGAAELGLVALSSAIEGTRHPYWIVPGNLYEPIVQDAVLLKTGRRSAMARKFLDFLQTRAAREIIESEGYSTR